MHAQTQASSYDSQGLHHDRQPPVLLRHLWAPEQQYSEAFMCGLAQ